MYSTVYNIKGRMLENARIIICIWNNLRGMHKCQPGQEEFRMLNNKLHNNLK